MREHVDRFTLMYRRSLPKTYTMAVCFAPIFYGRDLIQESELPYEVRYHVPFPAQTEAGGIGRFHEFLKRALGAPDQTIESIVRDGICIPTTYSAKHINILLRYWRTWSTDPLHAAFLQDKNWDVYQASVKKQTIILFLSHFIVPDTTYHDIRRPPLSSLQDATRFMYEWFSFHDTKAFVIPKTWQGSSRPIFGYQVLDASKFGYSYPSYSKFRSAATRLRDLDPYTVERGYGEITHFLATQKTQSKQLEVFAPLHEPFSFTTFKGVINEAAQVL